MNDVIANTLDTFTNVAAQPVHLMDGLARLPPLRICAKSCRTFEYQHRMSKAKAIGNRMHSGLCK